MKRIRVLIVDDAAVMRRMVADVLAADPAIEVIGAAANGHAALRELAQVVPDAVTLAVGMAQMDWLATLGEIRRTHPSLPVIVFTGADAPDAAATLDALSLGAADFVIKPSSGSLDRAQQRIREDLIPKIKGLCPEVRAFTTASGTLVPVVAPVTEVTPVTPVPAARAVRCAPPAEAIAIGASTGGPNALAELIPALTVDLQVPILIVQHMPPVFTRLLAERLHRRSSLPVVEASADLEVKSGHVYLAPGGLHMTVRRQGTKVLIGLNQEPAENSCRPAIDVLFRAMSRTYGTGALGVVLTGLGQDGLRGAEHIVRHGGRVLAQDEATSAVWGMPGLVVRAGLADRVLPLALVADVIVSRTASVPAPQAVRR